ncbi:MAG: DUF4136 domain-containing protein [Candidatus Omnitrophota bacterium]
MHKVKIVLTFFLSLLFLSGCASYYAVTVNDYLDITETPDPIPAGASFCVLANKNENNPILDNEIKAKIEKLLVESGYKIASYEKADFYLSFSYSVSSGRRATELRPVFQAGQTETVQTYKSSGKTSTSIINLPGYTTYVPYRITVFTSSLTLNVLDAASLRANNQKKIIWIGENSSASQNSEIRDTINYLLVASFENFGRNTGRSIKTEISTNDTRVKQITWQEGGAVKRK